MLAHPGAGSPQMKKRKALASSRSNSEYFQGNKVKSSKMLIEEKLKAVPKGADAGVSALYLPASKRVFNTAMADKLKETLKKAVKKKKVETKKQIREDEEDAFLSSSGSEHSFEGETLDEKNERLIRKTKKRAKKVQFEQDRARAKEGVRSDSEMRKLERRIQKLAEKEAKKREEEWKKRKPKRKLSFSEGMMKHDDGKDLKNPLRDAKGPSIMKARTIMQMIKAGRFPTRELIMNIPYQYEFFVDSITTAGYNSEEIECYAAQEPELEVPENSDASVYEYGLEDDSSAEEESEEEKGPEKPEEPKLEKPKAEKKPSPAKPTKVRKESLECHGFSVMALGAYPGICQEGDIPNHLLAEKLGGKLENIGMIVDELKAIFDKGKLFPSLKQTQLCYEQYCADFRTTPVQLNDYFDERLGKLHVVNQSMPDN